MVIFEIRKSEITKWAWFGMHYLNRAQQACKFLFGFKIYHRFEHANWKLNSYMGSMQHMLRRAVRGSHLIASGISDWATWSQLFRVVTNNTNYGKETPCKTWKSICLLFSSQSNLNLNSSLIVRDRVRTCFRRHSKSQNEKTGGTNLKHGDSGSYRFAKKTHFYGFAAQVLI